MHSRVVEEKARMAGQHTRGRPTSWIGKRLPTKDFADPVANAEAIRGMLPSAIEKAEAAGLAIIASHLGQALRMAERIATSRKNAS
jgi:hypothetical protein